MVSVKRLLLIIFSGLVLLSVACTPSDSRAYFSAIPAEENTSGSLAAAVDVPAGMQPVAQAAVSGVSPAAQPQLIREGVPALGPEPQPQQVGCANTPSDWLPYRVARGDNLYRIAVQHSTTTDALTFANCLANPRLIATGQLIYVPPAGYAEADVPPPGGSSTLPQTGPVEQGGGEIPGDSNGGLGSEFMPVVITQFNANRLVAEPGSPIRLTWATQGPVTSVQLGWLHRNTVVLEQADLPASGALDIVVPEDGRRTMPFVLQVSDGARVASAFATVQVTCATGWFFQPAPADVCPYPAVQAAVYAQQFQGGAVLYLSGLDRLYVLYGDGTWQAFRDTYRPGMPYRAEALVAPEGYWQPDGAIGYLWRTEPGLRERLGWVVQPGLLYGAPMQRAVYPDRDVVYIAANSGMVYALVENAAWEVINLPAQPQQDS